ncbi:MAG: ATP-binding protein [Marmoricola sp.]
MSGERGRSSSDPWVLRLPFAAESAGAARRALDHWLIDLGPQVEVVADCRLVVSELVGNAVRHAQPLSGGEVEVSCHRDEAGIDIAVADGGAGTRPRRVHAGLSDLSGRGLVVVEALASRWWVETAESRTVVHARVGPA